MFACAVERLSLQRSSVKSMMQTHCSMDYLSDIIKNTSSDHAHSGSWVVDGHLMWHWFNPNARSGSAHAEAQHQKQPFLCSIQSELALACPSLTGMHLIGCLHLHDVCTVCWIWLGSQCIVCVTNWIGGSVNSYIDSVLCVRRSALCQLSAVQ